MSGSDVERLYELVKTEPVPRGSPEDEVSLIAEAAWCVIHPTNGEEAHRMKEELRSCRLARLSEWLNSPCIGLIMGGATKIKQYVFESLKLPEIRGASGLLDRINLRDVRALFTREPSWLKDLRNGKRVDKREIQDAQQLVEKVRQVFKERHNAEPLDCEECIIYANGGEVLAFAPRKLAEFLAEAIERHYTSETLLANSVAVWRSCSLMELRFGLRPLEFWVEDLTTDESLRELMHDYSGESDPDSFLLYKGFGEVAAALALEKLRRREGNIVDNRPLKPVSHFETIPYARRCASCELRAAVVLRPVREEQRWLCEPCARKSAFGQQAKKEGEEQIEWFKSVGFEWRPLGAEAWANKFDKWLNQEKQSDLKQHYYKYADVSEAQTPNDLEDIAAAAKPEGFIGVIYADGNNMGSLLEELRTPTEYQEFAEEIHEAIKEATFKAIARHLHPRELDGNWLHSFEVLSIGGDDVFLIVPAHAALPIAISIAEQVEARLSKLGIRSTTGTYEWRQVHRIAPLSHWEPPMVQSRVSLSSGVVIANHHTPILFLQRLVEELLKSAKKKARKLRENKFYGATIDFAVLKSIGMIANNISDFRGSALRRGKTHLTAKPYTLPELEALFNVAREFKKSAFPRTQLYRLRRQIEKGWLTSTVDYLYFRSRLPKEHAEEVRDALDAVWIGYKQNERDGRVGDIGLWLRRKDDEWEAEKEEWETVLGDLAEIYDFVPEKGESNDK